MNGHTPGPWIVAPSTAHAGNPDSKRVDIHSLGAPFSPSYVAGDIDPCDARLIAAAPDMLQALESVLNGIRWDDRADARLVMEQVRRAVDSAVAGITPDARHADPVAILRQVLRWYRETTDGEMPPDLHDAVCRAVGEEVVP